MSCWCPVWLVSATLIFGSMTIWILWTFGWLPTWSLLWHQSNLKIWSWNIPTMTCFVSTNSTAGDIFTVPKMSPSTIWTTSLSTISLMKNTYLMIGLLQHAQQPIFTTNILFHQPPVLHYLFEILRHALQQRNRVLIWHNIPALL